MATKAKTDNNPNALWAATMDYTGVYGPFEAEVDEDGDIDIDYKAELDSGFTILRPAQGLKWKGDGIEMCCAYIAKDKKEVMAWLKGVQATHKMFRSAMRKGK